MKTIFSLRFLIMTTMLSFALLSCDKENMLPNDTVLKNEATAKNQITTKGITQPDKSEDLQIELPVTKEMEAQVIEVVKPVKEIVEKLLNEDKSGMYQAYKEDLEKLNTLKDDTEKENFIAEIHEKYYDFFYTLWKKTGIDEGLYQLKIKNIFPSDVQETIEFTEFLNFQCM